MADYILHKADSRGFANHGWLKSFHTFSFGGYQNMDRIHFGKLRVLNDDVVEGGAGFPTHPHDNMEIVSIPLKGKLAHADSTGTEQIIHSGEVQIMSAGSGLTHSEYNGSKDEEVNFLQIWVFPNIRNIEPRYEQKRFLKEERLNKFQAVVHPSNPNSCWINQDAIFSLIDLEVGKDANYPIEIEGNGVYIFVLEGQIEIDGNILNRRDGMGISNASSVNMIAKEESSVLLIEIPMR